MFDWRKSITSDPDDPNLLLDNQLKQIKLFALDLTYITLVWVLLFIGVSFTVAPIYLVQENERPALIRGLQVNARFFLLSVLIIVGGKLVQETVLTLLIRDCRDISKNFSEEQIEVLKQAANRQLEKRKDKDYEDRA